MNFKQTHKLTRPNNVANHCLSVCLYFTPKSGVAGILNGHNLGIRHHPIFGALDLVLDVGPRGLNWACVLEHTGKIPLNWLNLFFGLFIVKYKELLLTSN